MYSISAYMRTVNAYSAYLRIFLRELFVLSRLQKMCDDKNITFTFLERELGFSKSSIRRWNGNAPSIDKVQKVADYFNCTVDYLLGRVDEPNLVHYEIPNSEGMQIAIDIVEEAIKDGLTPEDIKKFVALAKEMKNSSNKD